MEKKIEEKIHQTMPNLSMRSLIYGTMGPSWYHGVTRSTPTSQATEGIPMTDRGLRTGFRQVQPGPGGKKDVEPSEKSMFHEYNSTKSHDFLMKFHEFVHYLLVIVG